MSGYQALSVLAPLPESQSTLEQTFEISLELRRHQPVSRKRRVRLRLQPAHRVVEATPARTFDEVAATETMIERTQRQLDLKPKRLAADTAYGTGRFLAFIAGAGIAPHIPVWDKSTREDGTFSRSDFRWDKRRGVYICPNNKVLHTSGTAHEGRTLLYRASKLDCDVCPLKVALLPKSTREENSTRYP